MSIYQAIYERDGSRRWLVRVPELPGVLGYARRRADLVDVARNVTALWLDVPEESVSVDVRRARPDEEIVVAD